MLHDRKRQKEVKQIQLRIRQIARLNHETRAKDEAVSYVDQGHHGQRCLRLTAGAVLGRLHPSHAVPMQLSQRLGVPITGTTKLTLGSLY